MLAVTPGTGFSQVLFSDNFDATSDWQSAETYSPASNAAWPRTWADRPGGPSQPPPKGWTSYRAAIPSRGGHAKTYVLSAEGARNHGGKGMTYNIESNSYGTWAGGGLDVFLGTTGHKELYMRLYLKFDPNTFRWGTVVPNFGKQKIGRISRYKLTPSDTNNPQQFLSSGSNHAPTFYPDIMNNPAYNSPPSLYPVHVDNLRVLDPGAGDAIEDNIWTVPLPSDGGWHCYEYR